MKLPPYLRRWPLLLGLLIALLSLAGGGYWWLRPAPLTPVQVAERRAYCFLWRSDVGLAFDSLVHKYRNNREEYSLQLLRYLNDTILRDVRTCAPRLPLREVRNRLDQVSVQVLRRDEAAIRSIIDLQNYIEAGR
jgi:hypothetical protein